MQNDSYLIRYTIAFGTLSLLPQIMLSP